MVRNGGKLVPVRGTKGSEPKSNSDHEVDALFKLPLAEFINARKALAARLKQAGNSKEADRVKALAKPSVSAWAVNQLYWTHREAFDRLMSTGQRFRAAQTSRLATKVDDMRGALEARREVLLELSNLAAALLRAAGHSPTPDNISRITTTLEAMSAYAAFPDAPPFGRLTQDVDPPGFDSLSSFTPGAGMTARTKEPTREPLRLAPSPKSVGAATTGRKASSAADVRQLEAKNQAKIAAARVALQDAKRDLIKIRNKALTAQAAQKKAQADAKEKEKQRREAELRFEKAKSMAEDAARRARTVTAEAEEAAQALEDAELTVEQAAQNLESLTS